MNITIWSSKLCLLKLILLVTFSLFYHTSVNAEDSLYERGKELVALKEYEKAIKAFELASKTGNLDALTALGVMLVMGVFAGILPAFRAVSVRPVEAIRTE